jgi:hypothetical protein
MKTNVMLNNYQGDSSSKQKRTCIRSLIFLLLFALQIPSGKAQGIQIGIFVDPQVSWMSSDNSEVTGNGSRMGFNFGVTIHKFFAEKYAITSGISLNYIGGKLRHSDITPFRKQDEIDTLLSGTTITYKLQYLNLPFGLTLKTDEIGYMTYFAQLGIDFQFNLKATGDESNGFEDEKIDKEVNLFNLGYHFGIGLEYSLGGNTSLVLGLSFNQSLIDVTKDFSDQPEDRVVINNISLRVGVNF